MDSTEIVAIATDFLNALKQDEEVNSATIRTVNSDFEVNITSKSYYVGESTSTRSGESLELPVYEVSVTSDKGDGVLFVSADPSQAEVLSYAPIAAENKDVFIHSGAAFLVEWTKASAYERLLETEEIRQKLRGSTIAKICKTFGLTESEIDLEDISDRITVEESRALPITYPTTQVVLSRSPIVKVEWGQRSPYNLALEAPLPPATQANVYTGCAVTAACQMMTAIKPNLILDGTVMNWDYLAENSKISTSDPQDKIEMVGKLH